MSEKPILFSGPMVRAILDGRKTQTRRVVKPQPDGQLECVIRHEVRGRACWMVPGADQRAKDFRFHTSYEVGTKLWVRETWGEHQEYYKNGAKVYTEPHYIYKADGVYAEKWRPSIHMPKAAARIWLEVIGVRVERLQEITYDDCLREGMWNCGTDVKTLAAFQDLWQNLNAKRGFGWNANPYVWVYELKILLPRVHI